MISSLAALVRKQTLFCRVKSFWFIFHSFFLLKYSSEMTETQDIQESLRQNILVRCLKMLARFKQQAKGDNSLLC